jgi:hypothetical protein
MISTSYRLETEEVSVGQIDICRGAGLDPEDTTSDRPHGGPIAQHGGLGLVGAQRAQHLSKCVAYTDWLCLPLVLVQVRDFRSPTFIKRSPMAKTVDFTYVCGGFASPSHEDSSTHGDSRSPKGWVFAFGESISAKIWENS